MNYLHFAAEWFFAMDIYKEYRGMKMKSYVDLRSPLLPLTAHASTTGPSILSVSTRRPPIQHRHALHRNTTSTTMIKLAISPASLQTCLL